MQAVTPVDVYVENDRVQDSNLSKDTKISNRRGPQAPRMRTRVLKNTKPIKTKPQQSSSSNIPKQLVIPKITVSNRSRSSSPPNREPWYKNK